MSQPDKSETRRAERTAGLAIYGATVVGMAGVLLGFGMALTRNWGASATYFVAAALAFGLLANALLRR